MRNRIYKILTGHRGKITGIQDQVKLGIYARSCEVCTKNITRKISLSGRYEAWQRFFTRKTCGMLPNGKKSECFKTWLHGENNPKWRGGLPICQKCGKVTAWYRNGTKNPQNHCIKCYKKIISVRLKELGKLQIGIYPEVLRPFAFKKGQIPWNKKIYV